MKKKIILLFFISILFSCSENTISEFEEVSPLLQLEKELVGTEFQSFDSNGELQEIYITKLAAEKIVTERIYDGSLNLLRTSNWEYNSLGLVSTVTYLDASGNNLPQRNFWILYDAFGKITEYYHNNCHSVYKYHSDNTITEESQSGDQILNTFHLNENGRIYKSGSSSSKNVEFRYDENEVIAALTKWDLGSTTFNLQTEYSYSDAPIKGFSYQKNSRNHYGSANNAIIKDGISAIESRVSIYYDQRHTTSIKYSDEHGDLIRLDTFEYSFDSEGYLVSLDIISGGVLRGRYQFRYEDKN